MHIFFGAGVIGWVIAGVVYQMFKCCVIWYGVLKRYILNCYMKFVMQEQQQPKRQDCCFRITDLAEIYFLFSPSEVCHAWPLDHVEV